MFEPNKNNKSITNGFSVTGVMFVLCLFCVQNLFSQAVISVQDFEVAPAAPTMTYTNVNGAIVSGSSGASDGPASSPLHVASARAWGCINTTSTLTFSNNTGLGGCNTKYFTFKLASWSIGSAANGADAGDIVTVEISLDGGTTWSSELRVLGNSNAYWPYTATGAATVAYDGNNAPTNFQPAGGGSRGADGYSSIRINLPDACTQARIRITMLNNSANERWTIDNVTLTGTCPVACTPAAEPTINASAITVSEGCTSAQINFTGGNGANAIIVMSTTCPIATNPADQTNYSSNSTFGAGSVIGAGNYVVYNGAAGTTIVNGLSSNTTYCFKIYEYNGATGNCDENYLTTGVASTTFTTAATCTTPQIRSILVNACTTDEGFDEIVIMTNGNSALSVSDIEITYPSGGTFCNSGCGALTLTNNAGYINSLNTLAGCTLFYYADPIPAGAIIFVFTGLNPTMTFDYSAECPGGGPYYVIFSNNTTDNSGRFANSAGANRTLSIDFNGSTDAVTYLSNNANTGDDGDYVSFDNAGSASYGNFANCAVTLPVDWGYFNVATSDQSAWINWSTHSEINNDYFVVEYANKQGEQYTELGRIKSKGIASKQQHYSLNTSNLKEDFYYFRIRQVDLNGEYSYSGIATANIFSDDLNVTQVIENANSTTLKFNQILQKNAVVTITDITGKNLGETIINQTTDFIEFEGNPNGIILVSISHPNRNPKVFKIHLK